MIHHISCLLDDHSFLLVLKNDFLGVCFGRGVGDIVLVHSKAPHDATFVPENWRPTGLPGMLLDDETHGVSRFLFFAQV
jgi:hypothetical protein